MMLMMSVIVNVKTGLSLQSTTVCRISILIHDEVQA